MLRMSTIDDKERIYFLVCQLEQEKLDHDAFVSIYHDQLKYDNYKCLVYEIDNIVIGLLNLRIENQLHHAGKVAEIIEFIIDENYRDHGIGKLMLEAAFDLAKNEGCQLIEVSSNIKRIKAHAFYEAAGMINDHHTFTKSL